MWSRLVLVLSSLFLCVCVSAVELEIPAIETPFNFNVPYGFPGPEQSLYWSTAFYEYLHQRLDFSKDGKMRFWNRMIILSADLMMSYLPLGNAWLHEEWHRGVMGRHGVSSYNAVYDLKLFGETISVNHVMDTELARLKLASPPDFVRLSAAGMESEIEQNWLIERRKFFDKTETFDQGLLFLNYIGVIGYINTCNAPESTTLTDKINAQEGSNIPIRDFTGLDCLGWVYDLFRPYEAYAARGVHPSGVGINRYRTLRDLSDEERKFLNLQANLSFLNLINPTLWPFLWDNNRSWTFSLKHYLTSFGYAIDLNFLMNRDNKNIYLQIHDYQNARRVFLGATVGLWKYKNASYAVSIWQQPKNQLYNDESDLWGGKVSSKFYFPYRENLEVFLGASAKTAGWFAGDLNLGAGFDTALGFVLAL